MNKLNWVIAVTGSGKAAGEDDVAYEFIKHLGPKARAGLLILFNRCWRGEGIPTKWLRAISDHSSKMARIQGTPYPIGPSH